MAKLSVKVGSTSQTVNVFIQDSSSTTGAGKTGLAFNSSGLTGYYMLPRAAATSITLATLAAVTSAYSSGGFKEIDSTNAPGWYRFDIPDAALASGRFVGIHLQGVTNMAPLPLEIELTGFDNQSTTDGNLSRLTSLTFTGANKVDASVRDWVGDTIPARNVTGVPIIDAKYLLGTVFATPATAGILDANVKNVNNVSASSVTTINANQGTTQPVNFTGTGASALAKSDMVDVAGAAVSTASAQIGVNVINAAGTAWASGAITAAVIADAAIDRATFAADTGLQSLRSNTAQAGAGTTITLDASASAVNSFYNNALLVITGGTGVGQARFITAYVGATKVATVATWGTNPDNTSTFAIMAFDAVAGASAPTAAQVATAVWQDLLAGSDFSTSSSIGKLLKDDIDAAVSSRMATYTQPTGFLAATFPTGTVANTTNITAATGVDVTKILGTAVSTPATAGILDVNVKNMNNVAATPITTVKAVQGLATDGVIPTATNLTNAPTAGDFTAVMKTSIGTAVAASAVASVTAGVTVTTNNDKTGYSLASGGIGSGAHAAAELNAIADALLDRNMATGADNGTDSTVVRTVRQALRRLRNKEAIAAGTGTITKEDDSTASWTYAATTTAGNPISSVDPT